MQEKHCASREADLRLHERENIGVTKASGK
jgi:hypothetical protein